MLLIGPAQDGMHATAPHEIARGYGKFPGEVFD